MAMKSVSERAEWLPLSVPERGGHRPACKNAWRRSSFSHHHHAFVPKKVGRKRKVAEGNSVFVRGKRHTLVHASELKKWKTPQGICSCCYARAPPPPASSKSRRKRFMKDGTRIPQPSFACNVCEVRLCVDCHYNEYPPHLNDCSKPRSIIYSSVSL